MRKLKNIQPQIQSNFYKLNHHYPEKNFKLKKENLIEFLSAVLQLIENSSNISSHYRSSTVHHHHRDHHNDVVFNGHENYKPKTTIKELENKERFNDIPF